MINLSNSKIIRFFSIIPRRLANIVLKIHFELAQIVQKSSTFCKFTSVKSFRKRFSQSSNSLQVAVRTT